MSIKHWPVNERPQEKLLHQGPQVLSDAELLAIFLRTGSCGKDVLQLARDLLGKFGDLRQLLSANLETFCQADGLGPAKFAQLQAVIEMYRRQQWQQLKRQIIIDSPQQTRHFLSNCLRDQPSEVFCCIFLDNRHRPIHFEELFHGTLDTTSVYPREVIKKVLAYNAAAVIFAHNHPSGIATASLADKQITAKLHQGLQLLDVRVLDHLIIGDNETFSFAEAGLL